MYKNAKKNYEPPCVDKAVPLLTEGSMLVVDSVKSAIDNDGQVKDGWYEDVDYWD